MDTVRVDFKNDLGEQYVEMRVFKTVPWGLSKALSSVGDVEHDDMAKMTIAERVATSLVVGGDVKNAWSGDAMSFPLNADSVQEAPVEMLLAVLAKFGEMRKASDNEGNASPTA